MRVIKIIMSIITFGIFLFSIFTIVNNQHASRMVSASIPLPTAANLSRSIGEQEAIYHVRNNQNPSFENVQHNLDANFVEQGVQFIQNNESWSLQLDQVGYEGKLYKPPSPEVIAEDNRLEYVRANLTEWYINGPDGIQQGFTFQAPPSTGQQRGDLVVALTMNGSLKAHLNENFLILTDEHDEVVLTYSQLIAFDATGTILPSRMELDNNLLKLRVNDRSAVYPVTIDPIVQQQTVLNPTPGNGDLFASSVSLSDDVLVVGAPYDNTGSNDSGVTYIYDRATGNLLHTLINPTPGNSDYFGFSVSVSGNTVVVGAPYDNTNGTDSGVAYIYDRATGNLLHTLINPTPGNSDYFGFSVSISGNTVVVGAPYDNTNGTDSGVAYIYDRATGNLLHTLTNPTPASADYFGYSVSISGDTLVVGSPYDNANGTDSGVAYIYDRATGNLLHTLTNPTPASADYFGQSVSISGDTLVVGAPYDNANGTDSGAAYVYDRTTGNLLHTLTNPTPASADYFGYSVSISGDTFAVGVPNDNDGSTDSGVAYIYDRATGMLMQTIINPTVGNGDLFGSSVSVAGNSVLVGVPSDNAGSSDSGVANLFFLTADYGDAPEANGYFTTFATDGARHNMLATNNPMLGASVDDENDGQSTATADGDDNDSTNDEDGVTLPSAFPPGGAVNVTVTAGTTGGNLDAWIDWNQDGDWDDADEQIATSLAIAANGSNTISVSAPASAVVGTSFARFRFSSIGGLSPVGQAPDGEVEDYEVAIGTANNSDDDDDDDDNDGEPQLISLQSDEGLFNPSISQIGILVPGQAGVIGEQLEWLITVSNADNVVGQNVVITSVIDSRLRVNAVNAPNATVEINGQTVIITYPIVGVGEAKIFSIFTTVVNGVGVTNTACVQADNQLAEQCVKGNAISVLPQTGETPWMRNWILALMIIFGGIAGAVFGKWYRQIWYRS